MQPASGNPRGEGAVAGISDAGDLQLERHPTTKEAQQNLLSCSCEGFSRTGSELWLTDYQKRGRDVAGARREHQR